MKFLGIKVCVIAIFFTLNMACTSTTTTMSSNTATSNSPSNSATNIAAKNAATSPSGYKLGQKVEIGGDAGWDYLTFDPETRHLFVTHYMNVEVLDADTLKSVGQIKDTKGVHGVALVTKLGKGYTSNGKADTVSVIDLKTFEHKSEIKTGKKPDAIVYNPNTDRIYVSNGESDSLTVIDPNTDKVVATIPVGGAPEFSAFDDKGNLWTNLEDKNAFVTIDTKTNKVTKTSPIAGCDEPASLAFDAVNRRLFIGCKNNLLAIADADSGKLVKTLPIGEHVDATLFDAASKQIFASTGDGFLTIIKQESADNYSVLENVKTMRGAKTIAFDPKTGRIFSATVENIPDTATAPPAPIGKVAYTPGPFVVIIVEK